MSFVDKILLLKSIRWQHQPKKNRNSFVLDLCDVILFVFLHFVFAVRQRQILCIFVNVWCFLCFHSLLFVFSGIFKWFRLWMFNIRIYIMYCVYKLFEYRARERSKQTENVFSSAYRVELSANILEYTTYNRFFFIFARPKCLYVLTQSARRKKTICGW